MYQTRPDSEPIGERSRCSHVWHAGAVHTDIGLSLEHADDMEIVRIRDTGIGITAKVLPRVFDMFVQAEPSSQRAVAGLGIGFALVRSHAATQCRLTDRADHRSYAAPPFAVSANPSASSR